MKKQNLDLYTSLVNSLEQATKVIGIYSKITPMSKCFNENLFYLSFERRTFYDEAKKAFYYTIKDSKNAPIEVKKELKRKGFDKKTIEDLVKKFEELKDWITRPNKKN